MQGKTGMTKKAKVVQDRAFSATSIKIPADLLAAVRAEAYRTHRSVSGMISLIAEEYVERLKVSKAS